MGVNDDGFLVKKFSYLIDYIHQGLRLGLLSLWDFIAQVAKIRKSTCRQAKESMDSDEDTESDDSSSDIKDIEDLLTMKDRPCPRCSFMPQHEEVQTHHLCVHQLSAHYVVVPSGPAIPRRDQTHVYG